MGTNYGQYNGTDGIGGLQPNKIDECKLWLDGKDSKTISLYSTSGEAVGWADKSQKDSNIILYESNFSNNIDGWQVSGFSGTGGNSIGGKSACLKLIESGSTQIYGPTQIYDKGCYRLTYDYYFNNIGGINPTANIRYQLYNPLKVYYNIRNVTQNIWHKEEFYYFVNADAGRQYLSIWPSLNNINDELYIKNWKVEEISGNHMKQLDITKSVPYDGSSILSGNGTDQWFNFDGIDSIKGDIEGEIIYVHDANSSQSFSTPFAIGADPSNYIHFPFHGGEQSYYYYFEDGISDDYIRMSNTVTNGYHIAGFRSDSNKIYLDLDGQFDVPTIIEQGSNNGNWFANIGVTPTSAFLGKILNGTVRAFNLKEILYFSPMLTNKKRHAIYKYLNSKYEVY